MHNEFKFVSVYIIKITKGGDANMRRSGIIDSLQHRKSGWKKHVALLLAVSLACTGVATVSFAAEVGDTAGVLLKDKYTGFEGVEIDWKYGSGEVGTYSEYLNAHADAPSAAEAIEIPLSAIYDENGALATQDYEGRTAVLSEKSSEYMEFAVDVPANAFYQLEMDYYLVPGESDEGKRILYIDGIAPFNESSDITFVRYFKDESEPVINSIGDETRPAQVQIPGWRTTGLEDTSGIYADSFALYLEAGSRRSGG